MQQDRVHAPCSGTTDDGTEAPCSCACHLAERPVAGTLDDLFARITAALEAMTAAAPPPPGPVGPVNLADAPPLRPDAIALTWVAHGVLCALAWHPRRRSLNGYVHAPNAAPIDWGAVVDVHGGISWARDGWIGFDTAHFGDWWPEWPSTDPLAALERRRDWTLELVIAETEALAAQVKAKSS